MALRSVEQLQQRVAQLTAAAEQQIQQQSGGAALCRLPGVTARDAVKVQEGRLAVLTALRRGLRDSEFTAEDALMSEMMEIGAHESNLQEGRRIRLPLEGDLESDARTREAQRKQFGCDPLDVEAMLSVSFPRP